MPQGRADPAPTRTPACLRLRARRWTQAPFPESSTGPSSRTGCGGHQPVSGLAAGQHGRASGSNRVACQVEGTGIVDLGNPATPALLGIAHAELAAPWEDLASRRIEPPTWARACWRRALRRGTGPSGTVLSDSPRDSPRNPCDPNGSRYCRMLRRIPRPSCHAGYFTKWKSPN
jgi:hypothetical protein